MRTVGCDQQPATESEAGRADDFHSYATCAPPRPLLDFWPCFHSALIHPCKLWFSVMHQTELYQRCWLLLNIWLYCIQNPYCGYVKEVVESWIGTRIPWARDHFDCMHLLPQFLGGCIIIIAIICWFGMIWVRCVGRSFSKLWLPGSKDFTTAVKPDVHPKSVTVSCVYEGSQ